MRPRALTRSARAVATGAALVGLVLSATSCNAGRPVAASIEGREITTERLDELVAAFIEADPDTYGPQLEGKGRDTFQMSAVAGILNTLVIQMAQSELAERESAIPTEEERAEAEDLVKNSFAAGADAEPDPATGQPTDEAVQAQETSAAVFDALSEDTQDWLVDLRATTLALARKAGEGAGDVTEQAREVYDADPTAFSSVCIAAILVNAQDLEAVQQRLADGEDFGTVSAEVSIDPDIAAAQGSLGECVPASQLDQFLQPELVELIAPLDTGEVSDVYELPDGTVALFAITERQTPAFEDVQAQIEQSLPAPGEEALARLVQESIGDLDIHVDPRFGTWDASTGTITPPDGARTPEADTELLDGGTPTVPAGDGG